MLDDLSYDVARTLECHLMNDVRAEVTVEPFVEGAPGAHVLAAIAALSVAFDPEIGPFATSIDGPVEQVAFAVGSAISAAFAAGATATTISIRSITTLTEDARAFLAAIAPVLRANGVALVDRAEIRPGDQTLEWRGAVVAGARPVVEDADINDALPKLISRVEAEMGASLGQLDRAGKQQAAKKLEDLGAFSIRNAVEIVSESLDVSRATLYNYLNSRTR